MFNWKVFLAEFIGTFALVFIGAGAGVANSSIVGIALAHGLILMVFVYAYGHISGTHVNPAVSLGLAIQGAIKWSELPVYWVAQFLGGVSGAGMLFFVASSLGGNIESGATIGLLTQRLPWIGLLVEALLTFFLVNTILHTAVAGKGGSMAGLAIGMTLTASIFVGAPLTGASLNPARTFGPALYIGTPALSDINTYLIYFVGPFLGAALAALVFNFFNGNKAEEAAAPAKAAPRSTSGKSKK